MLWRRLYGQLAWHGDKTALALAVVGGEVGAAGSHNGGSHRDGITPDGGAGLLVFGAHCTADDAHRETEESELNTLKEDRPQELGCVRGDSIYLGELTHNSCVAKTAGLLPIGGKVLESAEASTTGGQKWESIFDHVCNGAVRAESVVALHEMKGTTTFLIIK